MQPGLEDAANDRQVQFAGAEQQPGEKVEACVPAEVTHSGGVALAHLDQPGGRYPLERLANGGPGHTEEFGEPALARQRLPRAASRR